MLHLEFNSDSENEGIARIVTAAYIMKFDPDMEEMGQYYHYYVCFFYRDELFCGKFNNKECQRIS